MTNYINTQTGAYPVTQYDIEQAYPNTSFPTPFVPPVAYAPVVDTPKPSYNWITQGVRELEPVQEFDEWKQVWEVYELSPEQIAQNEAAAKNLNKQTAGNLLQQTDWTATVDINNPQYSNPYLGNQDAFLTYRSQVRAIAVNPPVTVSEWPTKPEEVWVTV